jgi:hypothetical protein
MSITTGNNTVAINDNWYYYPNYTVPTTYTYTWQVTNTVVIEKYQLICPNCEATNWGQIDEIIVCKTKKCGATLKATKRAVDYEVVVD